MENQQRSYALNRSKYSDDASSCDVSVGRGKQREANGLKKAESSLTYNTIEKDDARASTVDTRNDDSYRIHLSYRRENSEVPKRDVESDCNASRSTRHTNVSRSTRHTNHSRSTRRTAESSSPGVRDINIRTDHYAGIDSFELMVGPKEPGQEYSKREKKKKYRDTAFVPSMSVHSQLSTPHSGSMAFWSELSVKAALAVMKADGSDYTAEKAANAVLEAGKKGDHLPNALDKLASEVSLAVLEVGADHKVAAAVVMAIVKNEVTSDIRSSQGKNSSDAFITHMGSNDCIEDCPSTKINGTTPVKLVYDSYRSAREPSTRLTMKDKWLENDQGGIVGVRSYLSGKGRLKENYGIKDEERSMAHFQGIQSHKPLTSGCAASVTSSMASKRRHLKEKEDEIAQKNKQLEEASQLHVQKENEISERMAEATRINMQREIEIRERLAALDAAEAALLEKRKSVQLEKMEQIGARLQEKEAEIDEKMAELDEMMVAPVNAALPENANNKTYGSGHAGAMEPIVEYEREFEGGNRGPQTGAFNVTTQDVSNNDERSGTSPKDPSQQQQGGNKTVFEELTGRLYSYFDPSWVSTEPRRSNRAPCMSQNTDGKPHSSYGTINSRRKNATPSERQEMDQKSASSYSTYSKHDPEETSRARYNSDDSTSKATNVTGDFSSTWNTSMSALTEETGRRSVRWSLPPLLENKATGEKSNQAMSQTNPGNSLLNQALYQAMKLAEHPAGDPNPNANQVNGQSSRQPVHQFPPRATNQYSTQANTQYLPQATTEYPPQVTNQLLRQNTDKTMETRGNSQKSSIRPSNKASSTKLSMNLSSTNGNKGSGQSGLSKLKNGFFSRRKSTRGKLRLGV